MPLTDPQIADLQRQLRDACEDRRKLAQDAGDDDGRQYWLIQRRIIESSISARELPRPEVAPAIYTHHRALHAAYPGVFEASEVLVDIDLGPGGEMATPASIDAAFAQGTAGRLVPKLDRAARYGALVLIDLEPLPYRDAAVPVYAAPVEHLVAEAGERYPGVRLALYYHCGRFDRLLVGEARIAEGHAWWSQPDIVAEIEEHRATMDATLAAFDVAALAIDVITPVCYQSREFHGLPEDRRYRAVDWLPPVLAYAAATGHEVIPIVWLRSFTPTLGETVDADLAELRSICQIIYDAGYRRVMLWVGYDDPIDTPEFAARLAVVQEYFR